MRQISIFLAAAVITATVMPECAIGTTGAVRGWSDVAGSWTTSRWSSTCQRPDIAAYATSLSADICRSTCAPKRSALLQHPRVRGAAMLGRVTHSPIGRWAGEQWRVRYKCWRSNRETKNCIFFAGRAPRRSNGLPILVRNLGPQRGGHRSTSPLRVLLTQQVYCHVSKLQLESVAGGARSAASRQCQCLTAIPTLD
jgi:hypothetical protein